jgi:hypothetical protein
MFWSRNEGEVGVEKEEESFAEGRKWMGGSLLNLELAARRLSRSCVGWLYRETAGGLSQKTSSSYHLGCPLQLLTYIEFGIGGLIRIMKWFSSTSIV